MTIHSPIMQQLGRFYLIECQSKTGSYLMECDDLPCGKDKSEADAIALLEQYDDAVAIYEASEECGYFRNVSREIADVWLDKLAATFNPASDEWPKFIQRHVSPLRLEEVEGQARNEARYHANHIRQERNANVL